MCLAEVGLVRVKGHAGSLLNRFAGMGVHFHAKTSQKLDVFLIRLTAIMGLATTALIESSLRFSYHQPVLLKRRTGQPSFMVFLPALRYLHPQSVGQPGHKVERAGDEHNREDLLIA